MNNINKDTVTCPECGAACEVIEVTHYYSNADGGLDSEEREEVRCRECGARGSWIAFEPEVAEVPSWAWGKGMAAGGGE